MLIAQFSDLHIKPAGKLAYGRVDTMAFLDQALAHLAALPQRPDLLLLTGDLVDAGAPDEYERLHERLRGVAMPWLLIPGNHDSREQMRASFPEHPWVGRTGFWHFVAQEAHWPLRIIGLDTVVAGEGRGEICAERLAWLRARLEEAPDVPTLVAMHHPPFDTGIGHMDEIGLAGREGFAEVVARHPQVQLVVCGHLHRNIRATVGGRAVMTAPSTAHAVALDLAPDAASMFTLEPPGYLLHWWNDGSIVTHHVCTAPAEGPYPFHDPGLD
ncbi:MAG: phosphodiesterase [Rubrivivax sp.]|nr:phosphodiesterase [Rubrivivax sp.]